MPRQPERKRNATTVARTSEREVTVTRVFDGPAGAVFEAWSRAELFRLWWAPKSMGNGNYGGITVTLYEFGRLPMPWAAQP